MVPPRVGLYTAIYGGYNTPKQIPESLACHAVLFTDSEQTAEMAQAAGWCPRLMTSPYDDLGHDAAAYGDPGIVVPMLRHKWFKTHPLDAMSGYDVSIWIDGSMQVTRDDFVDLCLTALGDDDWAMMTHPSRDCIYPEADYSATLTWRYDAASINAQSAHYRAFHPAGTGLIATGFNVRRHTDIVEHLGRQWWYDITRWSHQDQISLPVLLHLIGNDLRWNTNLPWHQWLTHWPHG